MKLIVAHANDRLIGDRGGLPWSCPDDLKFFQKYTKEHINVLFGGNTYRSLKGKPFTGRKLFIFSRTLLSSDTITVFDGIEQVLDFAMDSELVVAGGAEIYRIFLPFCSELIVSSIEGQYSGDTYFPDIPSDFICESIVAVGEGFIARRWLKVS